MLVKGVPNTLAVLTSLTQREGLHINGKWLDSLAHRLEGKIELSTTGGVPTVVSDDGREHELAPFVTTLAANEHATVAKNEDVAAINPWLPGHVNVTAQHRLERDDPARAAILQREAAKISASGDPSNPFSKSGWNVTRQMMLERNDPEKAAHLAAAAGVKI